MVLTPLPCFHWGHRLGFSLPDVHGNIISRADFQGKPLLVIFMCNHCPYVKHIRPELARFAREYQAKGLGIVGINSNDVENHPADSPEKMKIEVEEAGYTFPYLYDESQEVAKAYTAACTPDLFLFDSSHALVYRGQFDDTRPNTGENPNGRSLREAADAVLAGKPVPSEQKPSIGCNIKWKKGNEPAYFQ